MPRVRFFFPHPQKELEISPSVFTDCATLSSRVESWWPPMKSLCTDFHLIALQALRWERKVTDSTNHINFIVFQVFFLLETTYMGPLCCPNAALGLSSWSLEAEDQEVETLVFTHLLLSTKIQFVFSFSCVEQIPPTQKVAGEEQNDSSLHIFPVTEVPDVLSLEIGVMLQQHPKHPTKPKRTLFLTTGTKLLSITTAQRFKPAPRLWLCESMRETTSRSPRWVEHLPLGWRLLHISSWKRHHVACSYMVWIL